MVRDAIELVLGERRARGESIPATGWAVVEAVEIAACRSERSNDILQIMAVGLLAKPPSTSYGRTKPRASGARQAPASSSRKARVENTGIFPLRARRSLSPDTRATLCADARLTR